MGKDARHDRGSGSDSRQDGEIFAEVVGQSGDEYKAYLKEQPLWRNTANR